MCEGASATRRIGRACTDLPCVSKRGDTAGAPARCTGQASHEGGEAAADGALLPVWDALCAGRLPPPSALGSARDADGAAGAAFTGISRPVSLEMMLRLL